MLARRGALRIVQENATRGQCFEFLFASDACVNGVLNDGRGFSKRKVHSGPEVPDVVVPDAVVQTAEEMGMGPINFAVQAIDSLHGMSGLPWWATIPLAATAIRTAMLPITIQQIRSSASTFALLRESMKVSKAMEGRNEQPNSDPPSDTKKTDRRQVIGIFNQLRRAVGAPHPIWIVASPLIQIPVFISSVMAVRRMSLSDWPGFSTEGALWFTDLTQHAADWATMTAPMGISGGVLPLAVTVSYLASIEVAFKGGRIGANTKDPVAAMAVRVLKIVLEWISIPVLVISFQLPQGTLLYWLTNSLYSIGSNLAFSQPFIRKSLQLGPINIEAQPEPQTADHQQQQGSPSHTPGAEHASANMVPPELLPLFMKAAKLRAEKKMDESLAALEEIVAKDGGFSRAHYAKGQLLSEMKQWGKAADCYVRAAESIGEVAEAGPCWLGAGVSRIMEGELELAETALLRASELNSWDVHIWLSLTSLYKKMGEHEKAKSSLAKAVELDPKLKKYEEEL
ncbi:hypothetical protein BSKO_02025 [Bryopsis sp. KO-2023]|nr:hypothetical protein BSKO_02025 [Bryopsis sp. KO-2023]